MAQRRAPHQTFAVASAVDLKFLPNFAATVQELQIQKPH
jgi:hypothetical protein